MDPWIAASVFAVIMLVFLVIWELTDDHPIINLRLFANRNFRLGTILLTLGFSGFFSINLILPQWLQSQMGYTPVWAGLAAAPMGMIPLFLTPILGRFGPKTGYAEAGCAIIHGDQSEPLLTFKFHHGRRFPDHCAYSAVYERGIGISLFFMPMTTILLSDLSGPAIADAASLSTFIRTLGASFASSVTTWFWTHDASLHHSVLTEQLTRITRWLRNSVVRTQTSALMSINNTINHQSYMLSTLDLFDILMCVELVLSFLLRISRSILLWRVLALVL